MKAGRPIEKMGNSKSKKKKKKKSGAVDPETDLTGRRRALSRCVGAVVYIQPKRDCVMIRIRPAASILVTIDHKNFLSVFQLKIFENEILRSGMTSH